jgi:Trk K+ transport system NAD-binding subunit
VKDRAYGIAYSFLGPIFFISLGFSITFDISVSAVVFIATLTIAVIVGQVLSAGGMALRMGFPYREALTVGVGMCGRAEMAFILAALALAQGAIDQGTFTALIFTAFLLNLFTPLSLKGCAVMLQGRAAVQADATRGILQIDTFSTPLVEERYEGQLMHSLPDIKDAVVIFGYGPEVVSLIAELDSRAIPTVVVEANESSARRLHARGLRVVHASIGDEQMNLRPLSKARALVANGPDEDDALLAATARDYGFTGPIVALIDNPNRRAPMQLAGATAAFTPTHVLAAAVAVRASALIGPRITGVQPLAHLMEVAEIRIHDKSTLANKTMEESGIQATTGAHIVGQWVDDALHSPPAPDEALRSGMILVAVGSPDSIKNLSEIARPITQEGTIVVAGFGDVGSKVVEMLLDAGENVCVIDATAQPGVDVVGDVLDTAILRQASVAEARVVILACENDSSALLVATVVRDFAPDVPIIACAALVENVGRIQKAGADFAISVGQVSGQLLAYHVLGQMVSQQARIKLAKLDVGSLVDHHPLEPRIRELTGCTVIAVERSEEVIMDIPPDFILVPGDALYVCGTVDDFDHFYEEFTESRS